MLLLNITVYLELPDSTLRGYIAGNEKDEYVPVFFTSIAPQGSEFEPLKKQHVRNVKTSNLKIENND
jgi:hypothetical protein